MSLIWHRSKYKTITNRHFYQQKRGGLHLSLSAQKSSSRFYCFDEYRVRTAGETGTVVEILPHSLSVFYFIAFLNGAKLPFHFLSVQQERRRAASIRSGQNGETRRDPKLRRLAFFLEVVWVGGRLTIAVSLHCRTSPS